MDSVGAGNKTPVINVHNPSGRLKIKYLRINENV